MGKGETWSGTDTGETEHRKHVHTSMQHCDDTISCILEACMSQSVHVNFNSAIYANTVKFCYPIKPWKIRNIGSLKTEIHNKLSKMKVHFFCLFSNGKALNLENIRKKSLVFLLCGKIMLSIGLDVIW